MSRTWLLSAPVLMLAAGAALAGTSLGSGDTRERPHPAGFTEGYGNEKVVVFRYPQSFYCNDELGDDLDGPGHRGDGVPAERDPGEFQSPETGPPGSPCIVGDTGSGSLPRMDTTGRPLANAERVWAILPFFDSEDPDPVIDAVDPTTDDNVDHQCPEPGPPHTEHRARSAPARCTRRRCTPSRPWRLPRATSRCPTTATSSTATASTRSGGRRSRCACWTARSGRTLTASAPPTRRAAGRA